MKSCNTRFSDLTVLVPKEAPETDFTFDLA